MSNELVTIAAFSNETDAHLARIRLEGEGIKSYLADANIAAVNWLYTGAVGGIKLQVMSDDAEEAAAILGMNLPEPPHREKEDKDSHWRFGFLFKNPYVTASFISGILALLFFGGLPGIIIVLFIIFILRKW